MSHFWLRRNLVVLVATVIVASGAEAAGQGRIAGPPASARQGALIELTGQWVAIVTEDWRWRMVTPPKGDAASVPLNPAGRRALESWNPTLDRSRGEMCKAFGPPGLIRQPGRIRIQWSEDNTLDMHFDAGNQVRRLYFAGGPPDGARTLQGASRARWFKQSQTRGLARGTTRPTGGSLEVVTTSLRGGYLRPNGVPYSDGAIVKEFFDVFSLGEDGTWMIVTTVVNDPTYLTQEFVISSQFRKEDDSSKWSPRPCDLPTPLP
jgi:hypothetical protein